MATPVSPSSDPAPSLAVPELSDYTQFSRVPPPSSSGATTAFRGHVRPFSNDQDARMVLRAIEAGQPLEVCGGRLYVDATGLRRNPAEDFLIDMAAPCTLLILEFPGTEHHRAYLLDPPMIPRLSVNPHIRSDRAIKIDGRLHPALCIYSGTLFRYATARPRLEQFLDQAAIYTAKHLIWLRTRLLLRRAPYGPPEIVYRRSPGHHVNNVPLLLSKDVYWEGYWPGPWAPSGPAEHLRTIAPSGECWCWSGKPYGKCCRDTDLRALRK